MAGNTPSTAINLGSATGGSQNFDNGSDTDSTWYYKLSVVGGMRYRIWIHPAGPGAPQTVFLGYPANASVQGSKIYADDAGGSTPGTQLDQIYGSSNPLFRDVPSDTTIWIMAHSTTAGIGQVRWESWVVDPDSPDEYNEAILVTGSSGSHAWDNHGEWRYYFKIVPAAGETLALSETDDLWDENAYFEVYTGEDESTASYYDWGGSDEPGHPRVPLITGDGSSVFVIMIYYYRNSGGGTFSWAGVDVPDPSGPNDNFANAIVLDTTANGSISYDNTGATKEPGRYHDDNRSLWYKLTLPSDGTGVAVTFTVTPSHTESDDSTTANPRVLRWTGDPDTSNFAGNGGGILYGTNDAPGTTWYLMLSFPYGDQLNWDTGGVLSWTSQPLPPNMSQLTAIQLSGSLHGNIRFPTAIGMFYRITCPTDGFMTIALTGPSSPYLSYIFVSGPSGFTTFLGSVQARPTDNPSAPVSAHKSAFRRKVLAGDVYYVQVSGQNWDDLLWGITTEVTWHDWIDTPPQSDNVGVDFEGLPIWNLQLYQGLTHWSQTQSKYSLTEPEGPGTPIVNPAVFAAKLAETGYPTPNAMSATGATISKGTNSYVVNLDSGTSASMMWHGENGGDTRVEWGRTAFTASQMRIDPNPAEAGDGGYLDPPSTRSRMWAPFLRLRYNPVTGLNEDVTGTYEWLRDNYGYSGSNSSFNFYQAFDAWLEQDWSAPKGSTTPWSVNFYVKIGTVSHTRQKGNWFGHDAVNPLAMLPGADPPGAEIYAAYYDNIGVTDIPWDGSSENLHNTITFPNTVTSSTAYNNMLVWYEDYKGLLSESVPAILMRTNITPNDIDIEDGCSNIGGTFGSITTVEFVMNCRIGITWNIAVEYPDQMRWGHYEESFLPFVDIGPGVIGVPGPVPNVVAIALGNGDVVLTWDPPYWDGGYPIEGYIITPYLDGVALDPIWVYGPDTGLIITGLEWGDQYIFTIIAYNAIGRGGLYGPSNLVTVGSPDNLPPFFPEHPLEVKLGEALWRKLGNENATYYGRIKIKIQDIAKWHQEYRVGDGPIVAYETHPLRMWNGLRWVTVTRMIGAKYVRPAP